MKRRRWTAMAMAIGASGVVIAASQTGTTPSGNRGTSTESAVTVVGCVQDGSQG
jgi:basic membrane lipoprotein Med (substrate-binding protein (PBP1-ABC) superfamily)